MNLEIYVFDKTKEDRLRGFENILCCTDLPIPPTEVKNEWCFFLQEVVEPMGWNAVWYVSRQECEELAIHFPTVLLVMVEDVDFKSFSAVVEIVAVKDEALLAKKQVASLRQLYPTIAQDEKNALNIERTADYLEQFRFFFDYIWMPWDEDSNEKDWPSVHLQSRLDLYYDLLSDGMRSSAVYVKRLLEEGKDVYQKIRSLETVIEAEGGQGEEDAVAVDQSRVQTLMELHVRQSQIKGEVELLESPVLRTLIVKKQQKEMRADEIFCVCEVATADEIIKHLTALKSRINLSAAVKMLPSLQEALDRSTCGQRIFTCPGIHSIKKCVSLEAGFITGLGGSEVTTITSLSSGSSLLQVWSREVTLEDLTLEASTKQMALAVGTGALKLRNCHVVSSDRRGRGEGVVVLEGGRLDAVHCKFVSFGTAICAKAGAHVVLESCSISDCHVGILLCETAKVSLEKTSIKGSKECGIKVETAKLNDETTVKCGSLSLLESFSEVKVLDCCLSNSTSGDVQIVKKPFSVLYDSADSGCSFTEM